MTRLVLPLVLVCAVAFALAEPSFAAADREASRATVLIPVAGTVNGANGTRFQTDLTIADQGLGPQGAVSRVDVYWLPQDARGTGAPVLRLNLAPRSVNVYEDFVGRTLQMSGVGSIILRTVKEDGTPEPAGRIDAFARIWTRVPNGSGTTSQGVYASTLYTPPIDDFQPVPAMIYGLRHDAEFRANYGIVNMSDRALTYDVTFVYPNATRTTTVTVQPSSMTQRAVPAGDSGPLTIRITVHQGIPPTLNLGAWTAFGSSVDNVTGDAWYSKAQSAYPHNEAGLP